jgi:C-terminal processing protease CtpA/Prc
MTETPLATPEVAVTAQTEQAASSTPLSEPTRSVSSVDPGDSNGENLQTDLQSHQPVLVSGTIEYTSPFFINSISQPFVLLEDQAGFVARDREFIFPPSSQTIGAVEQIKDGVLRYTLALPTRPQGTMLDLDHDEFDDPGVQVFAIAYWSNTWGDPFLEPRDGRGWSTAYASTIIDPENDDEIIGGKLLVWSMDNRQGFPSDFGPDRKLFTEDDPIMELPSGYSVIDLDTSPFDIQRELEPDIPLFEGIIAVNDYRELSYTAAFSQMFEKASREYPFTQDKNLNWEALWETYAPQIEQVDDDPGFYEVVRSFLYEIPDGHVGITLDPQVFFEQAGGSFGMTLAELSDGRIIVTQVLPDLPAANAGLETGAEIVQWAGQPVDQALAAVEPFFGPYSTLQSLRQDQLVFLTRVPPETRLQITYQNPDSRSATETELLAEVDYQSLFLSLPDFLQDELALPVESEILDDSGLGYIRINTFSDDYNLMARLWERALDQLIALEIPGLVLDVRVNGGGNSGLARDFAGYFFEESLGLYRRSYYSHETGTFQEIEPVFEIEPGPNHYQGWIAVLVSPDCVSACEGFTYALTQRANVLVIGHQPTAGAFGEVGRGQYTLPGDYNVQFPTGRSETLAGDLLLEGTGVQPDILVPVTYDDTLAGRDVVLETAISALIENINRD